MKTFMVLLALLVFAASCLNLQSKFDGMARFVSGVWEGEAEGYGGRIKVAVKTDGTSIIDIAVTENHEDPFIGGEAITAMSEQILETGSTDVDAVTGATVSGDAFLQAVENALKKASDAFQSQILQEKAPEDTQEP
ncbi:MAG: FMN-binding protein [Spirochaetaceae bacterium]|jgi:uncharacterized protein with FMN-binding domain|nr:FMN-binding protein [Spirochaetaceae bacterium]